MKLRLLSWNVNGYRAVLKKGFADFLMSARPDILGLQEVKSLPEQLKPEDTSFEGYDRIWNGAERKGYSGTAVFFRNSPLNSGKGFGQPRFDCEGRVITLEYDKFFFITCYFPNGGQGEERLRYKLDFYDEFLKYVNNLRQAGKAVFFCGDVNTAHKPIDLEHPETNSDHTGFLPVEREWIDKVIASGWTDTFRHFCNEPKKYTWWDYKTRARSRNVGWRLDYFFADNEHMQCVKNAFIMPEIQGSDHCPAGIDIEL